MPSGSWNIGATDGGACLFRPRGRKGKRRALQQILRQDSRAGRGRPGCPLYRQQWPCRGPLEASSPTYLHYASNTKPGAPGKHRASSVQHAKSLTRAHSQAWDKRLRNRHSNQQRPCRLQQESKEQPLNQPINLQSTKASAAPRGDHIVTTQSVSTEEST